MQQTPHQRKTLTERVIHAITPTLARPVLLLVKPMDFTFPSKYSLL